MSEPTNIHDDDIFHVILDALGELIDQIDRDETRPWEGYDDLEDGLDPKTTQEGYLFVLRRAQEFTSRTLDNRRSERVLGAARGISL